MSTKTVLWFFAATAMCGSAFVHAQYRSARFNMLIRTGAEVPLHPESFMQYWRPSAGAGAELVWFVSGRTGITLGAYANPFTIDRGQWTDALEPKLEGAGRLAFEKGTCTVYTAAIGLRRIFPITDRPFSFFVRAAGEYANVYQKNLQVSTVFPSATLKQDIRVAQSATAWGGCIGLGTELRLSKRWWLGFDAAVHYIAIERDPYPSNDRLIRIMLPPDAQGKGFATVSLEWVYAFGFASPGP